MAGAALLAVCLLALVVGGCVARQTDAASGSGKGSHALTPTQGDEALLAAVQKAFADDPVLSKEKIDISVKDGRVILTGKVSSGEVRIRAEDTARSVPEVFGVDAEQLLLE